MTSFKKYSAFLAFVALSGITHAEVNDIDGFRAGNSNTIGTGDGNGAFGTNNIAEAGSLAVGDGNEVWNFGFASGSGNEVDFGSVYSGSIGSFNTLESCFYATVLGDTNLMQSQNSSFILGMNNQMIFPSGFDGSSNILLGGFNTIDASVSGAPSTIAQSILIGAANTTSVSSAWVLGAGNIGQSTTVTLGTWAAMVSDASLIVGNGTNPTTRGNALFTLKNGKTMLVNKTWDDTTPLEDPDSGDNTDADGVALEVDGHVILNGAVIITEPQGDLSMGVYQ